MCLLHVFARASTSTHFATGSVLDPFQHATVNVAWPPFSTLLQGMAWRGNTNGEPRTTASQSDCSCRVYPLSFFQCKITGWISFMLTEAFGPRNPVISCVEIIVRKHISWIKWLGHQVIYTWKNWKNWKYGSGPSLWSYNNFHLSGKTVRVFHWDIQLEDHACCQKPARNLQWFLMGLRSGLSSSSRWKWIEDAFIELALCTAFAQTLSTALEACAVLYLYMSF